MFTLYADKNNLILQQRELITSGSVNVCRARFLFSEDWEGLSRTAVFRAREQSVSTPLDENGECVIPREVLRIPGVRLEAGVRGTDASGETVLPTKWIVLAERILSGAASGEGAAPLTPELWRQELAGKGDSLGYTEDGKLGLYSGEKLLDAVPVGGGEGGTTDHRALSHRDTEKQHPIQAIDGLEEELKKIPAPVEPLTNEDLEEMLK